MKSFHTEIGVSAIVAYHPNPDKVLSDIVEEMIWKPVQVTSAKAAAIKMKKPWLLNGFLNSEMKLREKVVPELL